MDFKDCIQFANDNPVCFIATMDDDQPRVRGFLMMSADESGFYFITFSPKQCTRQFKENPKVEICFYNNPPELQGAKQMRVTGEAEFLDDEELLEKAYQARAFLEELAGRPIKPLVEVFRISTGEAHFWTLQDVLKEPELERIRF
jgi:pyridoxamine 5'-phosphate oxidase